MYSCDPLHLVLLSGKGGVGKTTLACTLARFWARRFPEEPVLLLSTDPAHSLADILQQPVDDAPQMLADLPNLTVRAPDARRLLANFQARHGRVLEQLVERGSFVEGADLKPIWDLGWPGLEELMAILEIQRLLVAGQVRRVVIDMAPSGHTLSLLGLKAFLDNFLEALELFQQKHRVLQSTFGGSYRPDAADAFLSAMRQEVEDGWRLLRDPVHTGCLVVANAEPMSLLESERFLAALHRLAIPAAGLCLNRILGEGAAPDRLYEQVALLDRFAGLGVPLWLVPEQPSAPLGGPALDALAGAIQPATDVAPSTLPPAICWPEPLAPPLPNFLAAGRSLVLVGGKGGVGKTTVAATIALQMARLHPERRVLAVSVDPAHSLGDAFGLTLGHAPLPILPNLQAREIDGERVVEQFRRDYLWDLAEMMGGGGGEDAQIQLAYGPVAWRTLVTGALPGIDEMISLIEILESLETGAADLVVLDTAPTGHLLRLLEMPTALGDWLAWIFKLWLKYQQVVGHVDLMGRLRTLRRRVLAVQQKLKDPQFSEFIGVFLAQAPVVAETTRLVEAIAARGIAQNYLVWNRYQPDQTLSPETGATLVRLPLLPRCVTPMERLEGAGRLLFAGQPSRPNLYPPVPSAG